MIVLRLASAAPIAELPAGNAMVGVSPGELSASACSWGSEVIATPGQPLLLMIKFPLPLAVAEPMILHSLALSVPLRPLFARRVFCNAKVGVVPSFITVMPPLSPVLWLLLKVA